MQTRWGLQNQKIILYFCIVLGACALLNFFWNIPKIRAFFTRPSFQFSATYPREGTFNPSRRANYLLFSLDSHQQVDSLVVATFDPEEREVDFISIDPKISTNLAYGFGVDCLCGAFFKGDFQPDPKGIDILYETVSDTLGIPFDGYFYLDKDRLTKEGLLRVKNELTGVGNMWKIVRLTHFLSTDTRTNIPLSKLSKLYQQLWQVRGDKYNYIELGTDYYQQITDGAQKNKVLIKDRFDNLVTYLFNDPEIEKEATKVEIRNGTGKSGLASRASRLVANLGVEVVAVDNAELTNVEKTLIIDYNSKPKTAERLAYVFDGEVIQRPPEEGKRGDIVVVVGNNYYQKLNGSK